MEKLIEQDIEVFESISKELKRQREHIELIASENFVSAAVLEAQGSILTNKYAEGYCGRRYYGGCEYIDEIEALAIDRAKRLFNVKFANVQAHSGSQANMAAYRALCNTNDVILGMSLACGGHLTHGYEKNFSGTEYQSYSYGVDENGFIDYDEVLRTAKEVKPKVIVAGASAYSRAIDFAKFREICDEVGAYLLVDMAHIAGLVAANVHQNPCDYADVVTSTTHKTLRGPRGGLILTNNPELAKKINSSVFPGIQGGPLMHVIAGKAVAFKEALDPSFKVYGEQVVRNCKTLCEELKALGFDIVSGGTDNHLFLLDTYNSKGITGKKAETVLHSVNITCNKNTIPNETLKPSVASGIRLGTAAITTRGLKEAEMKKIAYFIDSAFKNIDNEEKLSTIRLEVIELMKQYPYV